MAETGEASKTATQEAPHYRKVLQIGKSATNLYMIIVDEGWRTWILCTDMYEWSADGLLRILRASKATWPQ